MIKIERQSMWLPDFVAANVPAIDTSLLHASDVTHIVFDLDKTIVPHRTNTIPAPHLAHIRSLKSAGFRVLIGSNTRRDIADIALLLDVPAIVPKGLSYKPRSSFYKRIVAAAGTDPGRIAMVGDNILNDIIGANRAGLVSVFVEALHPRRSYLQQAYIRYALAQSAKT